MHRTLALAPLLFISAPALAQALSCAGRDVVVCDAVNGIVDAVNAEVASTVLTQASGTARFRPTSIYARLLAAKNRATAGGCTVDGFSGGVYNSGRAVETWMGDLERFGGAVYDGVGTCSQSGRVWSGMADDGVEVLSLGDEYGVYNASGQVAGNVDVDGLIAGIWLRRAGSVGVYGVLLGTCPAGTDSAAVMDPWFDGPLGSPPASPEVPTCTSPPCTGVVLSGSGNAEPRGVFADATGVYWANRASGVIRRADLDGTNVVDFATSVPALGLVWGDDTYLYAPEYAGSGQVHRFRKSDGFADVMVTVPGSPPLHGIDFIDGAFYFTSATAGASNSGQLFRYQPGDAAATVVASGLRDRLFGLTHDPVGATTYLVSQGPSAGGAIGIVQTTAAPPVAPLGLSTAATGLNYPIQSQVHGSYVYIANAEAGNLVRQPLAGSTFEVVGQCASGQTYGVAVYQGVMYYTCVNTNELRAIGL